PSSTAPTQPSKTPAEVATLDDFSSLDLTTSELASLEAELSATSSKGFDSSKSTGFGTSRDFNYDLTPTKPLSFGKKSKGPDGEEVEYRKALPGDKLGETDPWDGIELTEEEARNLARELGLEDDEPVLVDKEKKEVEKEEGEKAEVEKELPPPPPVAATLATETKPEELMASTTSSSELPDIPPPQQDPIPQSTPEPDTPPPPAKPSSPTLATPPPPVSVAPPPEQTSVAELETESTTESPLESTSELAPKAPLSPKTTLLSTTSLEGPGGASLSAPIAEVEKLNLSAEDVEELVNPDEEAPTVLEIEPVSTFEKRVVAEAKAGKSISEEGERRESGKEAMEEEGGSGKKEVEKLKEVLNGDMGDTGTQSQQVPVLGVEDMDITADVGVEKEEGAETVADEGNAEAKVVA
ncbi:hypothetical protein P7C70_g8767, partial [Phenoliferia sp. Uapishka_3]